MYAVYYRRAGKGGKWTKDSEHKDFNCADEAEWQLIEAGFKTKIINTETGRRVRIPNPRNEV